MSQYEKELIVETCELKFISGRIGKDEAVRIFMGLDFRRNRGRRFLKSAQVSLVLGLFGQEAHRFLALFGQAESLFVSRQGRLAVRLFEESAVCGAKSVALHDAYLSVIGLEVQSLDLGGGKTEA
jgi:hypothetical protein